MYELRCPSCGHVVTGSFVRPGAIVTCPRCQHRYRVRDAHVRRNVARNDQPPAEPQDDPLLAGAPAPSRARTGERLETDAHGNVVGLSGLSEMMRRESAPHSRKHTVAPPLARMRVDPILHRLRKLDPRRRIILGSILGASLGVLTFLAASLILSLLPTEQHPLSDAPPVQRLRPIPLGEPVWDHTRQQFQPFDEAPLDLPLELSSLRPSFELDEKPALVFTLRLDAATREQAEPTNNGSAGDLPAMQQPAGSDQGVALSRVVLAVLDDHNSQLGAVEVPVALLGPGEKRSGRVALPETLADLTRPEIRAAVEVDSVIDRPERPGHVRIEPGRGQKSLPRIIVRNDTASTLARMTFHITGMNGRGQPVRQWLARWHPPLEPGKSMQLELVIPAEHRKDVASWRVEALGSNISSEVH